MDTSKFECFRNRHDGSVYYGEVVIYDKVTKQLVSESDLQKVKALPKADFHMNYEKLRHGYGLQIYNGQRNQEGVLTKYEGFWHFDKRNGKGFAVYTDGSTYKGDFKNDKHDGHGCYRWV